MSCSGTPWVVKHLVGGHRAGLSVLDAVRMIPVRTSLYFSAHARMRSGCLGGRVRGE